MAGVSKTKLKNKERNLKRVEWDSTTQHAFMRLSSILLEIASSQNGGDRNENIKRKPTTINTGGKEQ